MTIMDNYDNDGFKQDCFQARAQSVTTFNPYRSYYKVDKEVFERIIKNRNKWQKSSDYWQAWYHQMEANSNTHFCKIQELEAKIAELTAQLDPDNNPCVVKNSYFCFKLCKLREEGCYDLF